MAFIPADITNPGYDVDGGVLDAVGPIPADFALTNSPCIQFDDVSTQITLDSTIVLDVIVGGESWEVETLVVKDATTSNMLFGDVVSVNNRIYWYSVTDKIILLLNNGDSVSFDYAWSADVGVWKRVKLGFDGTAFYLDVDAVQYLDSGGTWVAATTTLEIDAIGDGFTSATYRWGGGVCDFKITQNNILTNHWPMQENAGDTVYDIVGGNHGTIKNAVTTEGTGARAGRQDVFHRNCSHGVTVSSGVIIPQAADGLDAAGNALGSPGPGLRAPTELALAQADDPAFRNFPLPGDGVITARTVDEERGLLSRRKLDANTEQDLVLSTNYLTR